MGRLFNDAATQYLENTTGALTTAAALTIACWFYSDDSTIAQALVQIQDKDVPDNYLGLFAQGAVAGDPVRFARVSPAGFANAIVDTTSGYTVNTWTHACGVRAGAQDHRVYISGGSKATNTTSLTAANTNFDSLSVGRQGDSTPSAYASAKIAEVAIWDLALSDAEVAQLAAGLCPLRLQAQNLLGYWLHGGLVQQASPEPNLVSGSSYSLTVTGATVDTTIPPIGGLPSVFTPELLRAI